MSNRRAAVALATDTGVREPMAGRQSVQHHPKHDTIWCPPGTETRPPQKGAAPTAVTAALDLQNHGPIPHGR